MYRPSHEKKELGLLKSTEQDLKANNTDQSFHIEPEKKIASSDLLHDEAHHNALLAVIVQGNFRGRLLPTLRKLAADRPVLFESEILALLQRLYSVRQLRSSPPQGLHRQYQFLVLNLSASGLSEALLSSLVKSLRVTYCHDPQLSKDLPEAHTSFTVFLQHIDLSNNNLTPTSRGFRQLWPSVCQRLAVWLAHPSCRLQSLNLSDNPALGGSTESFEPYLKGVGWGSDIYRIITGLQKGNNTSLEVLRMANTRLNAVDFEALAQMLESNAALRLVDVSNNPLTLDSRKHYNTMLERRYNNNRSALNMNLADTFVREQVTTQGFKDPIETFREELKLQVERLYFQSVGNDLFAPHKDKEFPHEFEYVVKLAKFLLSIGSGIVGTVIPAASLVSAISAVAGVAMSSEGLTHKIESLLKDFTGLSKKLSPELDVLLSFESIDSLYEVIKVSGETAYHIATKRKKLHELKLKINNNAEAKKDIDKLHGHFQLIAKLFLRDETLKKRIVITFAHFYHDIIRQLSHVEATRFAKEMGIPLRTWLLTLSFHSPVNLTTLPELILQKIQVTPFDIFQTLSFRNSVHKGYVRQREKSFKDIFGITRVDALKLILNHPNPADFRAIDVSLSNFIVNRSLSRYLSSLPRIYESELVPKDNCLKNLQGDRDHQFTLTELLTIHHDPQTEPSEKRRQLAQTFFALQEGEVDECRLHPALLRALAQLRGFTLYLWEYKPGRLLTPYHEPSCASYVQPGSEQRIDCVDESQVKFDTSSSRIRIDIHFSQIRFEGYPAGPTQENGSVPALSDEQIRENERSEVWSRDLLQRSGLVCTGADNAQICFDISKKVPSQAGKVWTQTDLAQFGCQRTSQAMLDIINAMVGEYHEQVSNRKGFSIVYNHASYTVASLTPEPPSDEALITMLGIQLKAAEGLKTAVVQLMQDSNTVKTLIKPLVEEALLKSLAFQQFLTLAPPAGNTKGILPDWLRWETRSIYLDHLRAQRNNDALTKKYPEKLKKYASEIGVLKLYIIFAVQERQLQGGWIPNGVLRALATVLNIHCEFYQLDESGEMSPHPSYTNVCPAQPKSKVQLLYLDAHRYVPLVLQPAQNEIPEKPFKWTCDYALVSHCGLYRLNDSTLKQLEKAGPLKAIELQDPDLLDEVKVLGGRVDEMQEELKDQKVVLRDQGERIKVLEQREVVEPDVVHSLRQETAQLKEDLRISHDAAKKADLRADGAYEKAKEADDNARAANAKATLMETTITQLKTELAQTKQQIHYLYANLGLVPTLQPRVDEHEAEQANSPPQIRGDGNNNNVQRDPEAVQNPPVPNQGAGNPLPQPLQLNADDEGADRSAFGTQQPISPRGQ